MTDRSTTRIRHEAARRRSITVAEKRMLTPGYLSIRFACDDLGDFVSAAPDDHIKLFVPGPLDAEGRPPMRDYTPRAFDPVEGSLVIDFALHEGPGPATTWAMAAQVGDCVQIGGPRGSSVIGAGWDWYWLIGDETALPAIARRMEEWPDAWITAFIAVAGADEEVPLPVGAGHAVIWVHRPATNAADSGALLDAIVAQPFPEGDGFVWIAAEAGVAKALREAILLRGHPQTQFKAAGYWTAGAADTTARFE